MKRRYIGSALRTELHEAYFSTFCIDHSIIILATVHRTGNLALYVHPEYE